MPVEIYNEVEDELNDRESLEREIVALLETCLQRLGRPEAVVDLTLVGEEAIQQLNREYRQVDAVTDVLSFAMEEGDDEPVYQRVDEEPELLGDIVICVPRAIEQAEEYGHSVRREFGYLAVHGLLHLLGYDHMETEDQKVMRAKEEELLGEAWGRQ